MSHSMTSSPGRLPVEHGSEKGSFRSDLRPEVRWVLLVASIAALAVALPAALLVYVPASPRSDAWIVTLLIMVWAGVRVSLLWVSGIPRLFDYFLWVFTYIFMGIAPTAQIRSGLTSTTTPGVDSGMDLPAASVVALGLVCYEAGRLAWMILEVRAGQKAARRVRPVHPTRTLVLAIAGVLIGGYFVSRIGLAGSLGSREEPWRRDRLPGPTRRCARCSTQERCTRCSSRSVGWRS
ncbi:hypothetical protein GCM10025863_18670 [Microbacterium suwonense]|uniref:Uncharacterized protein n=2 Tax=Microbacterium suwonense TaxID=683047 RepID=A0ABN6X379_9MICO|nr:hypothetical protein GCM10025863_18670 [Microbacterium suwonense]